MQIAKGVMIAAWIIVALNLAIAFGAIAVLDRMTPAIQDILEENEFSLEACEEMLAVLADPAEPGGSEIDALASRFDAAYDRAMGNITEPSESAALQRIADDRAAALAGDADARERMIEAIRELSSINREAMIAADLRAQQLGRAGAWGVVIMAGFSFVVQLVGIRLLSERVLTSFDEIKSVVDAQRRGETKRRFSNARVSPEIRVLYEGLNDLLDQRSAEPAALIDEAHEPPAPHRNEP